MLGGLRRSTRKGERIQLGLPQGQLATIGKDHGDVIAVVFEIQQGAGWKAEKLLSQRAFIHNPPLR
jgi:hypothetical protein